ncbi:MAG TPA: paraquat-inducible protein A [bacterium]|jgi:paraquat-inducible protein A|nr:paraquat-inducible protein A [bacterium]
MGLRIGYLPLWQRVFALCYLLVASYAGLRTVEYTNAATDHLDQACGMRSLRNEGAQVAEKFTQQHRIIGPVIVSYLYQHAHLPSLRQSTLALAEVRPMDDKAAREEAVAMRWSWALMGLSLAYLLAAVLGSKSDRLRHFLFAFTGVSAVSFVVGITASAMMISTGIKDFFGTTPVIQHEVRSVSSVIVELFVKGHWIFGGFVTLFSVVTPAVKIVLTFLAALTTTESANSKISKFLNAIGKWSMSDVFVAAILLACFTIKSAGGTQVVPFRGLNYFAAYCLLSMIATSLLHLLDFREGTTFFDKGGQLRIPVVSELVATALFLCALYSLRR